MRHSSVSPHLTPSLLQLIVMSNPSLPHTPPPNRATSGTLIKLGATPTRAGDNFVSSTNLGHTQQEIKSSLWGRILRNEPGLITHLIKPHLVDSSLVTAIEQALGENTELKAARDLLFRNAVPEKQMYMPMVSARVGYCGGYGPEKITGHTTPSYIYVQYSARTDSNPERRSDTVRIHSAQPIMQRR